jgi:hypothetical protein
MFTVILFSCCLSALYAFSRRVSLPLLALVYLYLLFSVFSLGLGLFYPTVLLVLFRVLYLVWRVLDLSGQLVRSFLTIVRVICRFGGGVVAVAVIVCVCLACLNPNSFRGLSHWQVWCEQ